LHSDGGVKGYAWPSNQRLDPERSRSRSGTSPRPTARRLSLASPIFSPPRLPGTTSPIPPASSPEASPVRCSNGFDRNVLCALAWFGGDDPDRRCDTVCVPVSCQWDHLSS